VRSHAVCSSRSAPWQRVSAPPASRTTRRSWGGKKEEGAASRQGGGTTAAGGGGTGATVGTDERGLAALRYRVERKRLFKAVCGLLELYCGDIAPVRTG
jgi:hypothetical protein